MYVYIQFLFRFQIDTINKSKCASINITITACADMHMHAHTCPIHSPKYMVYFGLCCFLLASPCPSLSPPKKRQIMAPKKVSNRFLFAIHAVLICSAYFLRVRGHGNENWNGDGDGSCASYICTSMTFNAFLPFLFYVYPALSFFYFCSVICTCYRFLRAIAAVCFMSRQRARECPN